MLAGKQLSEIIALLESPKGRKLGKAKETQLLLLAFFQIAAELDDIRFHIRNIQHKEGPT